MKFKYWVLTLSLPFTVAHAEGIGICSKAGFLDLQSISRKEILMAKIDCLYSEIISKIGSEALVIDANTRQKMREENSRLKAVNEELRQQIQATCPQIDDSCPLLKDASGLNLIMDQEAAQEFVRPTILPMLSAEEFKTLTLNKLREGHLRGLTLDLTIKK